MSIKIGNFLSNLFDKKNQGKKTSDSETESESKLRSLKYMANLSKHEERKKKRVFRDTSQNEEVFDQVCKIHDQLNDDFLETLLAQYDKAVVIGAIHKCILSILLREENANNKYVYNNAYFNININEPKMNDEENEYEYDQPRQYKILIDTIYNTVRNKVDKIASARKPRQLSVYEAKKFTNVEFARNQKSEDTHQTNCINNDEKLRELLKTHNNDVNGVIDMITACIYKEVNISFNSVTIYNNYFDIYIEEERDINGDGGNDLGYWQKYRIKGSIYVAVKKKVEEILRQTAKGKSSKKQPAVTPTTKRIVLPNDKRVRIVYTSKRGKEYIMKGGKYTTLPKNAQVLRKAQVPKK